MSAEVPVIDVAPLLRGESADAAVRELGAACREHGFFVIRGHGIADELECQLLEAARAFFALPRTTKETIRMALGGRAWRGYFPLGDELTSGLPDQKEGVYFGTELSSSDPRVRAGVPLHGPNLFLPELPALERSVLAWMDAVTKVGHAVMAGLAQSLGLQRDYFAHTWMREPTVLFRMFHYPPTQEGFGVGEHTDYGVLTLLLQDDVGGLEVKSRGRWLSVPPIPGTLVCNIGDMLDRMTGGLYRSTPHRVRNLSTRERYSFPLFFDPSWDACVTPLPGMPAPSDDAHARWDRQNVHAFAGTYGEYLLAKVSRVFPALFSDVIDARAV